MTGPPPGTSGLVGRAAELARGQRLVERAMGGDGGLLLIGGEAGIGKTVLATAFGEHAAVHGAEFAIGRCYEGGGMLAFEPWADLISALRNAGLRMDDLSKPFGNAAAARTRLRDDADNDQGDDRCIARAAAGARGRAAANGRPRLDAYVLRSDCGVEQDVIDEYHARLSRRLGDAFEGRTWEPQLRLRLLGQAVRQIGEMLWAVYHQTSDAPLRDRWALNCLVDRTSPRRPEVALTHA